MADPFEKRPHCARCCPSVRNQELALRNDRLIRLDRQPGRRVRQPWLRATRDHLASLFMATQLSGHDARFRYALASAVGSSALW